MTLVAAFLLVLEGARMQGPRLAASGALEELNKPVDADPWRDGQIEAGWAWADWGVDARLREVRRWGLDDGEFGLVATRVWRAGWRLEVDGSRGFSEKFLASWSLLTSGEGVFPGGWVLGGQWKASGYSGFVIQQPGLRIDRYLDAWRLGIGMTFPWYDGVLPRIGGKALLGWDWSDEGGVTVDFASGHEMERDVSGVVDRKSLSATVAVRQELTSRVLARVSGAWTRLENVHERMEVRLGIEWFLGR